MKTETMLFVHIKQKPMTDRVKTSWMNLLESLKGVDSTSHFRGSSIEEMESINKFIDSLPKVLVTSK